jgi:hypothetical protein
VAGLVWGLDRVGVTALEPIRVEIKSHWQGLGDLDPKAIIAVTIKCDETSCESNAGPVLRSAVDALINAFEREPVSRVTLHDLGITEESLRQLSRETRRKIEGDAYLRAYTPPGWLRAFENICSDTDRVAAFVEMYYRPGYGWTDDYPSVHGEIVLPDRKLSFTSSAQQAFMIPWTLQLPNGEKRTTYDVSFSRALAAVLPPRAVNRDRISDTNAQAWLVNQIRNEAYREVTPAR